MQLVTLSTATSISVVIRTIGLHLGHNHLTANQILTLIIPPQVNADKLKHTGILPQNTTPITCNSTPQDVTGTKTLVGSKCSDRWKHTNPGYRSTPMVLGGIKKERRQRLLATQFKRSISCVKNKHLPSTNYLTATPLSSSCIFFSISSYYVVLEIRLPSTLDFWFNITALLFLAQLSTEGSHWGRSIKVLPPFICGLQAAVSLPASPPPLSSSYLCSAAHCTMYRATGMRLNAWHPQPVFFWAASAQQHSPAQQQGWLQQHTLPELPNSVQMGRAR